MEAWAIPKLGAIPRFSGEHQKPTARAKAGKRARYQSTLPGFFFIRQWNLFLLWLLVQIQGNPYGSQKTRQHLIWPFVTARSQIEALHGC